MIGYKKDISTKVILRINTYLLLFLKKAWPSLGFILTFNLLTNFSMIFNTNWLRLKQL